ncbi:hypothetical protein GALMADRAFT_139287 [Galerina marginata CBS 339.88]|uniref:BHLH domain-containing protein n=1 Tax=Galerina marginata (strain CBS 339.88) TaxID=685588 RepID=A0A067T2B9_GALM3|nr:hypothetical protein GALMADRAFT_139287 [Galerina marginata CBS 339.88]
MPESLYAASCNPPRRAKRAPNDTIASVPAPSPPPQHRAILPMRPYAPRATTTAADPSAAPPPPAKRGRKPGPLSRTAREAQRRLNHSIIEKARRTKINDALATLKQLVPLNYGQQKQAPTESRDEDDEDEDEDDYDYDDGTKKPKAKPKGTGKKEEKEKEFKLEILVRTVSFLQDLLERVAVLEANTSLPCQNCAAGKDQKKRKRIHLQEDDHPVAQNTHTHVPPRSAKIPRRASDSAMPMPMDQTPDLAQAMFVSQASQPPSPTFHSHSQVQASNDPPSARLPPISSWLHTNSVIDPQLLPAQQQQQSHAHAPTRASPPAGSYLPSPPASTHFDPVRTPGGPPPLLTLGPVASAAMVSPNRTPEDESAASLLLQISASSPTFRPVSSSPTYGLPDPSGFLLHPDPRSQRDGHARQAQTPSSLLGLSTAARK